MGCGVSKCAIKAAVLIQRWYRQYVARTEMRRRCTWHIFHFTISLVTSWTISRHQAANVSNLISHIFRDNEVCRDAEWERYFCYKNIEVPEIYSGPHLSFPLTVEQAIGLVEAFRNKKVRSPHTKKLLFVVKENQHLVDLLFIFYKNGMPSLEKPYVFNGDFVDRGRDSMEILIILFAFLLVYPSDVHLNRGNHEDHIINLRYGFTKEVLTKYKLHGKRILKLTDLSLLARLNRHSVRKIRFFLYMNYASCGGPCSRKGPASQSNYGVVSLINQRVVTGAGSLTALTHSHSPPTLPHITPKRSSLLKWMSRRDLPPSPCHFQGASASPLRILDLLWSDPMVTDGCIPNEVRGGGCCWGPDVTEDFLNRHNLQLLIRSHECKQEGYEFCHNRKVLTLFSASNYYDVGSNRGAYVKLGPDLVPYVVQYQASSMTRELTVRQSVGRTERSALKVLREQLFVHKSDLISAFRTYDTENTGLINLSDWADAVEGVMHLALPWRMLRSQLVTGKSSDGMINYIDWFNELHIDEGLIETLYRHRSTVETIFRIVDTDNSGFMALEDFQQTWKLLSIYLKMEISDDAISDLAVTIDSNHDGCIDIEEFMEAFRLTDRQSRLERGRSMFMGTATDLTKLEGDPNI
uniref:Serine/threonine-protein phosphatase n=1 Tax=Neogobius melanostomus TaxID=47308 RepID=A0A8C6UHR9_9GOBI